MKDRKNTGVDFEELITTIQKCVHKKAKIEKNVKIPDVDTGELRQVDICLKLEDGPTNFFAIIEVRDRSRPVSVSYIEEIANKQKSVKANAAFIVSKSGFYQTAIKKAEKFGIKTLTYEEATNENWSKWISGNEISVYLRKWGKARVVLAEKGSTHRFIASSKILQILTNNKKAKVIKTSDGKTFAFIDIVNIIVNTNNDKIFKGVSPDSNHQKKSFFVNLRPSVYLENQYDQLREIDRVKLDIECWIDKSQAPLKLMKYRNTNEIDSIAEVASIEANIGEKKVKVEIIIPGAGKSIPPGAEITIRTTKIG